MPKSMARRKKTRIPGKAHGSGSTKAKIRIGKVPLIPVMVLSGSNASQRTKAVTMLAKELKVPVQRVDLRTLGSRHIGETEKHLNRILKEAGRRDAILFINDVEALFGSRSAPGDDHARDVYLNADYLLDRLEQHEGLTILATNRRGKLDKRLEKFIHVPLGSGPSKQGRTKKQK